MPFLSVPIAIYFEMDPYSEVFHHIIFKLLVNHPFLGIYRIIQIFLSCMTFFSCIFACRAISFSPIGAIIFGHLLLNCVQNLIHSLSKWNNITGHLTPLVLMFYNIFAITLSILNDGISTIIALAMGLACVIEVCTIFLAIKGRAVVPAAIYPIFPSLGFAIPVVSYTLLGDAVNVGETTRRLKTACNNHIAMRKDTVGYMKRRIRAVKVAQLSGGIFSYTLFFLNKCTKAMFYWSMLYYTNVACLSISL